MLILQFPVETLFLRIRRKFVALNSLLDNYWICCF